MVELMRLAGRLIVMFNQIVAAIDNSVENKREFITCENAFVRESPWSFDRNVKFQIFRQRTTTRHDINTFHLNSINHSYKRTSRGNYSRRRAYINPDFYKEVNKEYLKQIKYPENLPIFPTYKGYRLYAVDGLTLSFDNNKELRKDFNVKNKTLMYTQPSEAKFSAIMDLWSGYIIDAELGDFRQSERELFKINLKNSMDIIDLEKSIMTLDRGYVSLELMAWLNELNLYFVQRLKSNTYKAEVNQIKTCDSPINIKLNSSRLRGFKDPELKEKYSKELYLKLRLVTVELENGQKERLLTNIPPEIMTTDQIYHIYGDRWIIETNYNTLKNRHEIENYTSNTKENIKQDVYSTVLNYNISMHYYNVCNKLVNNKMIKQGKITGNKDEFEYKVDLANLIRNLKEHLFKMIINPIKENIALLTSWIIKESCLEPNKIKKNRKYPRYKVNGSKYSRSYGEM